MLFALEVLFATEYWKGKNVTSFMATLLLGIFKGPNTVPNTQDINYVYVILKKKNHLILLSNKAAKKPTQFAYSSLFKLTWISERR